jgi:hypothetical protein
MVGRTKKEAAAARGILTEATAGDFAPLWCIAAMFRETIRKHSIIQIIALAAAHNILAKLTLFHARFGS